MKASIRLSEGWEFARALPVEAAAVNHQATNHNAMPAQKLSGRVKNDISTQIEWPAQVRRGESGVDHQWQAVTVGDLSYCRYVEYFKAGVAQRFAEQQPGIGLDSRSESLRLARVDEGGLDAKARQRVFEQVVGATIERARGDDMRTCTHHSGDGEVTGSLAAGRGNCANAAFKRCYTFFQHGRGGVGDTRVDMPGTLYVKKCCSMVRTLEYIGRGLVDRSRPGPGDSIRSLASMQA